MLMLRAFNALSYQNAQMKLTCNMFQVRTKARNYRILYVSNILLISLLLTIKILSKMKNKKVYKGIIEIDDYGCLKYEEGYLIEQINNDFKKGDKIFVRYFITDKETTEEEAVKSLVLKTIGGDIDNLDFVLDAYSEYTIIDYNEEFVIGGHDLLNELVSNEGKYLILIIELV